MTDLRHAPEPDLRRLVEHLKSRRTDMVSEQLTISPAVYHDPEYARAERELVFGRVPVAVCHSSELPEPGAFLTTRLPNNETILVRQKDGSVMAFVNACRHRGSMLESAPTGVCHRRLQCPYHGWAYNLDGSLRSATHEVSFGDFDHLGAGLVRLPVEERHGFVWVIDSAEAEIDVAAWLGPEMDAILESYRMDEDYTTFQAGSFTEPVNWKVLYDAFLDGYHIQFVHKETANKLTYTNILTLEDYGRHTRFLSPRKKLGKLIAERGPDGELTDAEIARYANLSHGLLPNATLLYLPDHIQLLSFFPHPSDPRQSRMEMRLIVPSAERNGWDQERWQQTWERNWTINQDVIVDEDLPLARTTQRAVDSVDAGPLIVGRNEIANHVFRRELRRLIAGTA